MSTIEAIIRERFGGRLESGRHAPDGVACALEALSIARGIPWTDSPIAVRCLDLRSINDGPWSSPEVRAREMVPVLVALDGSLDWPQERLQKWATTVVSRTVREIISDLSEEILVGCRNVTTREEAEAWAARVARAAARAGAEVAAEVAAAMAAAAARAWARAGAGDRVLILACRIWREAAAESES